MTNPQSGNLKHQLRNQLSSKPKVLSAYHRLRGRQRFLKVVLDTTNFCNIKCTMCHGAYGLGSKKAKSWSYEEFVQVGSEVFPHAETIMLSCGAEPFMNRHIIDFVRYAKDCGIPNVGMVTNGLLVTPEKSRALIDAGIDRLVVSMDGAKAETYEKIRLGGNHQLLVDNLLALKQIKAELGLSRPRLTMNFVIMRSNIDEIDDFIDLLPHYGADAVDFRFMIQSEGIDQSAEFIYSDEVDMREIRDRIRSRCAGLGIDVDHAPNPDVPEVGKFCQRPNDTVILRFNGDVEPCPFWREEGLGNVFQEGFWNVWRGKVATHVRENIGTPDQANSCANCIGRCFETLPERESVGADA